MDRVQKIKFFIAAIVILCLFLFAFTVKDEDPLHNRVFYTSLSETKNGNVAKKPVQDLFTFKQGKLKSNFLANKFGYKWIRYHIVHDSTFVDSTETQVRRLVIEAVATDEKDQTVHINLVSCEWDLDGVVKITKHDKLKRYYDLAGREKGGKPPRRKKKESTPVFEILK